MGFFLGYFYCVFINCLPGFLPSSDDIIVHYRVLNNNTERQKKNSQKFLTKLDNGVKIDVYLLPFDTFFWKLEIPRSYLVNNSKFWFAILRKIVVSNIYNKIFFNNKIKKLQLFVQNRKNGPKMPKFAHAVIKKFYFSCTQLTKKSHLFESFFFKIIFYCTL